MANPERKAQFRTANSTGEQLVYAGPCLLYGIYPELNATTGTVTIRDAKSTGLGDTVATNTNGISIVCGIGMSSLGKILDGVIMANGITTQQSVGTDRCTVVYMPLN